MPGNSPPTTRSAPAGKSSTLWTIVGGCVSVAAVLLVMAYFVRQHKPAKQPAESSAGEAQTQIADIQTPAFWIARVAADTKLLDEKARLGGLAEVARLQGRDCDAPGVHATVAELERSRNPGEKSELTFWRQLRIVEALGRIGDEPGYQAARTKFDALRDAKGKPVNDLTNVDTYLRLGRFSDAIHFTRSLDTPGQRIWLYTKIATASAKASRPQEYEQVMQWAEADLKADVKADSASGEFNWQSFGWAAAAAMDETRLRTLTDRIKPDDLASMYARMAVLEWDRKNPQGYRSKIAAALAWAAKVPVGDIQRGYCEIARVQAAAGDAADVAATEKLAPVHDVSNGSIELEEFQYGLAGAYSILGDEVQVMAHLDQAEHRHPSTTQEFEDLHNTLEDARALLTPIYPPVIAALARKGNIDGAIRVARRAPKSQKSGAEFAITMVFAHYGRAQEAIDRVQMERDPEVRSVQLSTVGKALSPSQLDLWKTFADTLTSPRERWAADQGAAESLLDARNP